MILEATLEFHYKLVIYIYIVFFVSGIISY
jgi:hypothetical protein